MLALVARVAPSQAAVLLLGESGTGKELVAKAVPETSSRASRAAVSYTHLRHHETVLDLVCRLLPETKKNRASRFLT